MELEENLALDNEIDDEPWKDPSLSHQDRWKKWLEYFEKHYQIFFETYLFENNAKQADWLQVFCSQIYFWLQKDLDDHIPHSGLWIPEIKKYLHDLGIGWEQVILTCITDKESAIEDIKLLISWIDIKKNGQCDSRKIKSKFCKRFCKAIDDRIKYELKQAKYHLSDHTKGKHYHFRDVMHNYSASYHLQTANDFVMLRGKYFETKLSMKCEKNEYNNLKK